MPACRASSSATLIVSALLERGRCELVGRSTGHVFRVVFVRVLIEGAFCSYPGAVADGQTLFARSSFVT